MIGGLFLVGLIVLGTTSKAGFSSLITDSFEDTEKVSTSSNTFFATSSGKARMEKKPYFALSNLSASSTITAGNDFNVNIDVENTGDSAATKTLTLTVDSQERASTTFSLAAGATTSRTLTWATAEGDAGTYTATTSSPDDAATTSVSIESACEHHLQVR